MRIARVEAIRIGQPDWTDVPWWSTSAMDALRPAAGSLAERQYGLFNRPAGAGDPVFAVVVRLTTDTGLTGLGCIGLGSEAVASVVERQLAPIVLGHAPFDTEWLWETMYRSTLNIGRRGLVLAAISGVDIALWDVIGKAVGQPVCNLLGGRTRASIRAYASSGYAMEDLDHMAERARGHVAEGYTAMKMRFGYGPADGRAGMRRNVELVRALRRALGDDVDLMADAYMGWTTQYAIEMIRLLEPFDLTWVEEPVTADNLSGYARIRSATRTAIAGGEHEATRWGFRQMIEARAVDYVQLDVNRVGGVTEARKIWALAAAHDLPVVPHGPNFHNAHLIMAHLNSPLIEMFPDDYRDGDTFLGELFVGDPKAQGGVVTLPDAPGFGVELDMDVVSKHARPWTPVEA